MSHAAGGPGKTVPKLFHDFLLFDPLRGQNNVNYLTDVTPPVGEGQQIAPVIGACRHDYSTKHRQSLTPPLDLRPDGGTEYKTAVICKNCRLHADIHITYAYAVNPCPNSDYPLHHFQRVREGDSASHNRIQYVFQCSAPSCHAELRLTFKLPRISDKDRNLLTDTELLRTRYEAVIRESPGRDGFRQATPVDALTRLRKYIRDSLNPEHDKRAFPANNKRFMEAFGVRGMDCKGLLEGLGFKYADDVWTLPDPPRLENRLRADGTSHRELLEDVEAELLAWTFKLSAESGWINPAASEGWPSADRDIERTLAAQGYQRHATTRRAGTSNEETPYFSSLGALPDFSDGLVEYAFERQSLADPERRPYYFECLQVITEHRGTEQLQIKVATLASQDLISRRDLSASYRRLNIDVPSAQSLSDEAVIDRFHALQTDLGPHGQEEARQALYRIGQARHSTVLINAAKQTIDTYEDALAWLGNGVTKETSDESILAVATIKMSEGPSMDETAQKAIHQIALARKSNQLNKWLLTGRSDGHTMDVDEALRHLNITQKLEEIDLTIMPVLFENARADRPGEITDEAIMTLEKAMVALATGVKHAPETWPVGLVSHGNTCYLNSLLQYYFSIKPLRDIILAYDKFKLDTDIYAEKNERVGQRRISTVEIKGGQRFADALKHLFERMIKEPGPTVKPEEELVCRAFLEPKDYALLTSHVSDEAEHHKKATQPAVGGEASGIPAPISRRPSDASSVTLQDEAIDMSADELLPTPPTSPGLGPVDKPPANAPPLPPRRFSATKEEALSRAEANARSQQDVTEVHDGIMFRLRSGMMPEGKDASDEQQDALRRLFSIEIQETPVKDGIAQKPRLLTDSSIQLNVPTDETDIYSALDAVFDLQTYDEESNLEQYKSISALPPLLQINIPRIGYDKAGHGGTYKSDATIELVDELYLDRYVDKLDPSILPRRKSCWGWRKQLHALEKERKALSQTSLGLDGPDLIQECADYLDSLNDISKDLESVGLNALKVDPKLSPTLRADAAEQRERLSALRTELKEALDKLKDEFELDIEIKYRLAAVFFHRGGPGHGHYWIYINDFDNNIWRSYNDERVEEFHKTEDIYRATAWDQGTPTYAVYVNSDQADLVQAVCRATQPVPKVTINDVPMQDNPLLEPPRVSTVDPKLVMEQDQAAWDEERQVPAAHLPADQSSVQSWIRRDSLSVPGMPPRLEPTPDEMDGLNAYPTLRPHLKLKSSPSRPRLTLEPNSLRPRPTLTPSETLDNPTQLEKDAINALNLMKRQ